MTAGRTAKEWGRVAVSLPGWRWMPGMYAVASLPRTEPGFRRISGPGFPRWWLETHDAVPDPDDPATAGCLLALIHSRGVYMVPCSRHEGWWRAIIPAGAWPESASTLGRACIAAAEALGRWPGGVG